MKFKAGWFPRNRQKCPAGTSRFSPGPQNSVAGDYYDAFYTNPENPNGGKLMIVIADVAGKSVPAALLMATFQASLRTIAGDGAALAESGGAAESLFQRA